MRNLLNSKPIKPIFLLLLIATSQKLCSQGWDIVIEEFSSKMTSFCHDPVTDHLFIGGRFGYIGEAHVGGIVSFDGTEFYSYGCAYDCDEPFTGSEHGAFGIVSYHDTLYLTGISKIGLQLEDTLLNNIPNTKGIVKMVDGTFSGLDVPFSVGEYESSVMIPYVIDDTLFIINSYSLGNVAGYEGNGGALYDGSEWSPFALPDSSSLAGIYADLIKYEDDLYICGNFTSNQSSASDISRLVNGEWLPIGNGIAGSSITSVKGMTIYEDDLYVYGTFQRNPGNAGEGIMTWNGEQWSDLGSGVLDGVVYDAIVFQDELFVCGFFNEVGGIPANGVAKWDGNRWCSVGSQFYVSQYSHKFGIYQNELYISAREMPGANMVKLYKWNGLVDSCSIDFNSVKEFEVLTHIELFPNPTSSNVTISLPNTLSGEVTITIYNSLGLKTTEIIKIFNSENQIDISTAHLPSALYFLYFKHEETVGFAKLIKK